MVLDYDTCNRYSFYWSVVAAESFDRVKVQNAMPSLLSTRSQTSGHCRYHGVVAKSKMRVFQAEDQMAMYHSVDLTYSCKETSPSMAIAVQIPNKISEYNFSVWTGTSSRWRLMHARESFQMQILCNIFARISLHWELVPVQCEYQYEYGLFMSTR